MKTHTYYLNDWDQPDAVMLDSLLSLAARRLPAIWERNDSSEDADVLLIDVDSKKGGEMWGQISQRNTNQISVAVASQDIPERKWLIKKPLRINGSEDSVETGLMSVFTRLSEQLENPAAATAINKDWLWHALGEQENLVLDIEGNATMIIDSANETCFSSHPPKQWLTLCDKSIKVKHASPSDLKDNGLRAYPLDSLKWCLALSRWKGELSPTAMQFSTFQLKHWPDFTSIPHHPKHLSLAGYLTKFPSDVETIIQATEFQREFVHNFINACAATDLLQTTPLTRLKAATRKASRGLLGSLLSKLGIHDEK